MVVVRCPDVVYDAEEMILVAFTGRERHGTVSLCEGTLVETGGHVRFVSDWRPGDALVEALATSDEPVITAVPRWAIVGEALWNGYAPSIDWDDPCGTGR